MIVFVYSLLLLHIILYQHRICTRDTILSHVYPAIMFVAIFAKFDFFHNY